MPVKRRYLSDAEKAVLVEKHEFCCAECGEPGVTFEFDHTHQLATDGGNEIENFRPLCTPCHKIKTKADAKVRAKERRIRRKANGGYNHNRPLVKKVGGRVARNPNAKGRVPW